MASAEPCYPYNGQRLVMYIHGIREPFPTSSFGLGFKLGVHDSGVFWIASSLDEQIKMETCSGIAQEYLDIESIIDKVFEEFSWSQKIYIAFKFDSLSVLDLVGYMILRAREKMLLGLL
jgi:hypothetical protein